MAPVKPEEKLPSAIINAAVEIIFNPFFGTPSQFSTPSKMFIELEEQLLKQARVNNNEKMVEEMRSCNTVDQKPIKSPADDNAMELDKGFWLDTPTTIDSTLPTPNSRRSKSIDDTVRRSSLQSDSASFFGDSFSVASPAQPVSHTQPTATVERGRRCKLSLQERTERRRAQNRAAATRCRRKKHDQYTDLVEREEELDETNRSLHAEVAELLKTVEALRREVQAYKNHGAVNSHLQAPADLHTNLGVAVGDA